MKKPTSQPITKLTPAERAAKVLAHRGMYWNYTTQPTPSKPIHTARGVFKTA